jgi:putative hydrolases of HD superfamily
MTAGPQDDRFAAQLHFLLEADRLKEVIRRTRIASGERYENTAEHSWHLALYALVLAEHADEPIDVSRVIRMLLIHDLVEIDAGDTFAYDEVGYESKQAREREAADRLYGILPADQATALRDLWDEFEDGDTPDARFARAIDRLQPVLLNHHRGGGPWREHGITRTRVVARNAPIADGSTVLWAHALACIDDVHARGLLADE